MPAFQELWSQEPLIRLAVLDETMQFNHGSRVLVSGSLPPVLRRDNPLPASALDSRMSPRPETMCVDIAEVINPHEMMDPDDFVDNPLTDRFVTERVVQYFREEQYLLRSVGFVELGNIATLADVVARLQRLAVFFEPRGFHPVEPADIYRQYCTLTGVQPVADRPALAFDERGGFRRRIEAALRARDATVGPDTMNSVMERIAAGSATERSFQQTATALSIHIMSYVPGNGVVEHRRAIVAAFDRNTLADIDAWHLTNTPEARLAWTPSQDARERTPVPARPVPVDVARAILDIPAGLPGVRIPINHPGRRAVNVETPDALRDPVSAHDRLHPSGPGGGSRDAGGARRALRLDN